MNDQIVMENYLLVLKSTVEVFVHGTLESSNTKIKNLLNDSLNKILNHQADTYSKMTEYGWYKIENVKASQINQTLSKITKKSK